MAVVNINRNQFEEMVHSGNAVLVEFSAPWCVYCRRLAPALESVAEEYKDTLVFTAINIDDEPELAEAEAIEVVPTLLIYHSGQVLGSIVAPESRAQLVAFIEETLQHQTKEANTVQHIPSVSLCRLKLSGGKAPLLAVSDTEIFFLGLVLPVALLIKRAHRQHNVSVRIMTGRVRIMDSNICAHSLGNKVVLNKIG